MTRLYATIQSAGEGRPADEWRNELGPWRRNMPVIAYIRTWSWTCHLAGHVICVRRNLEDGDTYDA